MYSENAFYYKKLKRIQQVSYTHSRIMHHIFILYYPAFCLQFAPTLLHVLSVGPTEYAQRVERLLRRSFMVGTRGQPPSWLEFQVLLRGRRKRVFCTCDGCM